MGAKFDSPKEIVVNTRKYVTDLPKTQARGIGPRSQNPVDAIASQKKGSVTGLLHCSVGNLSSGC